MKKLYVILFLVGLVLLIRYYIILQYLPVKKIAPVKDGSLCPDIFGIYDTEVPFLSVPEKAYFAIPSSVHQKTDSGIVSLSIKNDGVLEYRMNGVLIWSSDDAGKVSWAHGVSVEEGDDLDIEESAITKSPSGDFSLTLHPFALYQRNGSTRNNYKRIWDLEGWESNFRPIADHPLGYIFMISENRHMQVSLLSNGDLVVVEKTSMSAPPKVKTSLLESFCND
jgi:hypothetical protein